MIQGTVKWFNEEKGFGFVTDAEGNDVFVHYTSINSEERRKNLKEGDKVEYTVSQGAKGPQADNVTVLAG
jgi:CspA family cold shock protein